MQENHSIPSFFKCLESNKNYMSQYNIEFEMYNLDTVSYVLYFKFFMI